MSKEKNDTVIKELMKQVETQKEALGAKERVSWFTNGSFQRDSGFHFNINTVTEGSVLAEALGFLIVQAEGFGKACDILGVDAPFKWQGFSLKEWQDDFETRMRVVEWNKKKKLLENTQAKLSQLVSEEARTEMELDDIKALLAG